MPLSMNLNRSNKIPSVTPCFDGKELHVDSEIVSTGLSAISVKGYDAGDRRGEIGIRHRNSFWSVHRPELSKLNWTSNHTPQNIENYLKVRAGNKKSDIPPADFNQLTVIHADSNQNAEADEDYLLTSKPHTTQFSDDDMASYTILHKSRAEFCVTIGHLGKTSISDTSGPLSSKNTEINGVEKNVVYGNDAGNSIGLLSNDAKIEAVFPLEQIVPIELHEKEKLALLSESYDEQCEKNDSDEKQKDEKLPSCSREMLMKLMDDTVKDRQAC